MARSMKSQFYLLVKSMLLGGTYTDIWGVVHNYTGVSSLTYMNFWNSELSNPGQKEIYPTPAVFFEFSESARNFIQQRVQETNVYQTEKDLVSFTLHLVNSKDYSIDINEQEYLDIIDIASEIKTVLRNVSMAGFKNINFENESQDANSSVLMDWTMNFSVMVTEEGLTNLDDANDPNPVPFVVTTSIDPDVPY